LRLISQVFAVSADMSGMQNKRKEPRLEASGPARVTLPGERNRRVRGEAANVSGNGLRLMLEEPVAPGTPLMVDWEGAQVMGEVCYCRQEQGGFAVGLKLERALVGTNDLLRLAHGLQGEPGPDPIRVEIAGVLPER
jgi:hypothetical protein